jgi:hypothetical protein
MSGFTAVLAVATLVGGVTGLWFLWDKFSARRRRKRAQKTLPQFAPGRWWSDGGTNTLAIERDLTWTWTSTFQGRYSGTGRGRVEGEELVLDGFSEGVDTRGHVIPRRPTSFRLKPEGDLLAGRLQTSRVYDVLFHRQA